MYKHDIELHSVLTALTVQLRHMEAQNTIHHEHKVLGGSAHIQCHLKLSESSARCRTLGRIWQLSKGLTVDWSLNHNLAVAKDGRVCQLHVGGRPALKGGSRAGVVDVIKEALAREDGGEVASLAGPVSRIADEPSCRGHTERIQQIRTSRRLPKLKKHGATRKKLSFLKKVMDCR